MADSSRPQSSFSRPQSPSESGRPNAARHHYWRFIEQHLPNISLILLMACFAALVLYPYMVINVESGQVGVLWKRFDCGTVMDPRRLKDEGLHIILPWDEVFTYNLRLQSTTETYNAISSDGVTLSATINIRFMLDHDSVPLVHEAFGQNYIDTAVKPEIGSRTREVIGRHTAEDVYTKRNLIETEIKSATEARMAAMLAGMGGAEERPPRQPAEQGSGRCPSKVTETNRHNLAKSVNLSSTLVLGIELPSAVVAAINRKIEQLYVSQEYIYRVERERRESERKQIEAIGIRDFQRTVTQGISDSYLRWRGIEATLQLAQSSNTKIVIVGSGRDGLPIILGNVQPSPKPSSAENPSDGSTSKPTAASPSTPSEKTPASHSSDSSDSKPASESKPASDTKPSSEAKPASDGKPETASGSGKSSSPAGFPSLTEWLSRSGSSKRPSSDTAKPADAKPSDSKPAQAKPGDDKSSEAGSGDGRSAESSPAEKSN
jgi:regulator of protease activity HflC (stomatin/prohibitin superfamily)